MLFIVYGLLIQFYRKSWNAIPFFQPENSYPLLKISVIIPARNEESAIGILLAALQQQTYPASQFEVIVIDDHSTDRTAEIVRQFQTVRLIQLADDTINSYKKKAIETGINAATGELIVTTDADCLPSSKWLQTLAAFQQEKKAAFIAAPVVIENNHSILEIFQSLDFLVLQGITGAAVHQHFHSMCNGANLAYEKNAFVAVNGFTGIDQLASGDDMLLMHKIWKQFPTQVHYLKSSDAIVSTQAMKTWKAFFNQRIRWASKARHYDDNRIIAVLLLVYLLNLSMLVLGIAGFWDTQYWLFLAGCWVIKTLIEWPFVSVVATFFNKQKLLSYFFICQPLHIAYTILSGFFGQIGSYEWKGRKVK